MSFDNKYDSARGGIDRVSRAFPFALPLSYWSISDKQTQDRAGVILHSSFNTACGLIYVFLDSCLISLESVKMLQDAKETAGMKKFQRKNDNLINFNFN